MTRVVEGHRIGRRKPVERQQKWPEATCSRASMSASISAKGRSGMPVALALSSLIIPSEIETRTNSDTKSNKGSVLTALTGCVFLVCLAFSYWSSALSVLEYFYWASNTGLAMLIQTPQCNALYCKMGFTLVAVTPVSNQDKLHNTAHLHEGLTLV